MLFAGAKPAFANQPAPVAKSANATLTIAELLTGIVTTSGTSAITLTLPTGTLTDAGLAAPALPVGGCFDWTVINTGTGSGTVTIGVGSSHIIVGSAAVPIATSAGFRTRKSAANSFVTYRVR